MAHFCERFCARIVAAAIAAVFSAASDAVAQPDRSQAVKFDVPKNARECDDIWDAIQLKLVTTTYGAQYEHFIRTTRWDVLFPRLCREGSYQEVYELATGYLDTGVPPRRRVCDAGAVLIRWQVNADRRWLTARKVQNVDRYSAQFPIVMVATQRGEKLQDSLREEPAGRSATRSERRR
jgi:hypothetical protein